MMLHRIRRFRLRKLNAERKLEKILSDKKHVLPGWSPAYLQKLGDVRTVIDVGVLNGTPQLYKAFPDAHLVLVEALPQYESRCREIVSSRSGEVHICAAGAEDGMAMINHVVDKPGQSSLLEHVVGGKGQKEQIEVPLRRLDTLFRGRIFKGNTLLKVDTEGAEYKIIEGASEVLKQVSFCIMETSIRQRHRNSYRFSDLVGLMKENGFDLLDILTVTRSEREMPGASITDALFISSALEQRGDFIRKS